jgi:hypothetical protein
MSALRSAKVLKFATLDKLERLKPREPIDEVGVRDPTILRRLLAIPAVRVVAMELADVGLVARTRRNRQPVTPVPVRTGVIGRYGGEGAWGEWDENQVLSGKNWVRMG